MKIIRFKFDKLVRDNVTEIMQKKGIIVHGHTMDENKYIAELKRKLTEEAIELQQATSAGELAEEIADVLEVLNALCNASGIKPDEIEESRIKKLGQWGAFATKAYISYVELGDDHPEAAYYRSKPKQYPEI